MTELDGTHRESNFRDSVKKYFYDNLFTTEGIAVSFDRSLSTPKVQGIEVDKWYAVVIGEIELGTLAEGYVDIYCCTKKDPEGFRLAQLRDKVMKYLIDTSMTDGMARVTFYRSSATETWTSLGKMVIQVQGESRQMEAEDYTKFKVITIRLRWGAK
ncbi:MAG: hypothetical protein WC346_15970 [Methanogenium sp.]|jgi:hypothetical protein